jgi:osmotically-inducible protein OsmY
MTLQKKGSRIALAGLLAFGLAACTADPDREADMGLDVNESDPAITASIQSKYFMDDTVKGIAIDVDTDNGVVTLAGTVASEAAKQRAVTLAESTEGVQSVTDRLVVRAEDMPTAEQTGIDTPEAVNPGWITTKVESQYFLDPDVKGRDIDVITATDGTVTLRGAVDSAEAKRQAVMLARNTEGVTDVVDELTVATDMAPADDPATDDDIIDDDMSADIRDAWITTKVQARFFVDTDVKGRDIDVETQDGVVTLNGEVETAAQRREAVMLARDINGVNDVVDNLRIVPATRDDDPDVDVDVDEPNPEDSALRDAWLTTKIQSQYFVDPDVSSLAIDVTTENRIVTLTGEVDSQSEKMLAETIARETEGVLRVVNQLAVGEAREGGGR